MIIFLDTGPTGGITNPTPKSEEVKALQLWAKRMEQAGHTLIIPAVVDYEQRREHLRRNATASIAALDTFLAATPNRYLYLNDSAFKRAAEIWAQLRKDGLPTADAKALDCDVILAAQVLDLNLQPGTFIVATSNVGDLARMVACDIWQNIAP